MPDHLGGGLRLQLLKRAGAGPSPRLRCAAFLIFFPQRPGMTDTHTDPLHGVTLEQILKALVEH
ncbi:DUF2132 domain-containing protein, partial [Pseudomonas sp. SIMBA_077]